MPKLHSGSQSYEGLMLGTGPVAYWPQSETSGTNAEELAQALDGTYQGAPTPGAKPGPIARVAGVSRAARYDDTGTEYVSLPNDTYDLPGAGYATMASWVKRASQTDVQGNALFFDSGAGALRLALTILNINRVQVFARSAAEGVQSAIATTVLDDNAWHHAVGVVRLAEDQILIYFDGVLKVTTSVNFDEVEFASTTTSAAKLAQGSSFSQYAGDMAHAAIWNRELTATEIKTLYLAGIYGG
jgi:hypothetical protein